MSNNKKVSNEKPSGNKYWQFVKKNGFTILMLVFIGAMLFSPDAKSFVLKQLVSTGLFNPNMDKKSEDIASVNDFDFADENGNILNTSSLRGKVVFINFWASWCPPCRAEFPSIETLYSQFKDNPDVFFLTVNEDSDLAKGRAYLDNENFSVPMYQSISNVSSEVYSGTLPTTLVLDKGGVIRYHHTGIANYASGKFIRQMQELIDE